VSENLIVTILIIIIKVNKGNNENKTKQTM